MGFLDDHPRDQTRSYFHQNLARLFAAIVDVINFLGKIAWPLIDIAFRLWMANKLLIAGILMAHHWDTSVLLAAHEYTIPWLDPKVEAFLGIFAEIAGGFSLFFGLLTRLGALSVLILALATQFYYVTLDTNLFWIVLMAGYVLRGPGPISLDHALEHGLERSPIPFATMLGRFFDTTRAWFSMGYLLGLRLWLGLTLLILSSSNMPLKNESLLFSWFPLHSAALIFTYGILFLAWLYIFGIAMRLAAILGFILICFAFHPVSIIVSPIYWMMTMAIFFVSGAGTLSLDQFILIALKRRYPQLSGKPAFTLANLPHVVIVGAGFGGIACAKALYHVPVRVSLIDRNNYHLFQPLLYQVATGSLSPADIAISVRSIFSEQFNAQVLLGEVDAIDKDKKIVIAGNMQIPYDYLVIATGATHSYFGKDEWAPYAPGLKQIEDATSVRSKLVETFELAEVATDEEERRRLLNFIIVGGGPTGVELTGAIAELARYGIEKDFRHFDPALANIFLIQAAPRILPTFSEATSINAQESLEKMGVNVLLNSRVEKIDDEGVIVNGKRIYSKSVLWAAGVTASPAAAWLGVEADPAGRVKVNDDLSIPGYPTIFVIGDTALSAAWKGKPVPGLAPAAKQEGKYVAKVITQMIYRKNKSRAFNYSHLGSLATIGRKSAVAEFNYVKFKGAPAWWFWGFVHVSFLVGARNRLSVMLNWAWSYFTFRANNLLITKSTLKKYPKKPIQKE